MKQLCVVTVSLLVAASAVQAKPHASNLKWMDGAPGLPSGVQMAVVSGNPGKKGMFKIQLKMPANYAVPPHSHPSNEMVQVLSGTLHYGMTDKLMSDPKTLTIGRSVTMKAKMNHWVHAPAPATVQVSGMGPFQITYLDPKDDPRNK